MSPYLNKKFMCLFFIDHLPIKTLNPFNLHIHNSYKTYLGGLESLCRLLQNSFKTI